MDNGGLSEADDRYLTERALDAERESNEEEIEFLRNYIDKTVEKLAEWLQNLKGETIIVAGEEIKELESLLGIYKWHIKND